MVSSVDQYGRALRDLRVSVTDRCNFRCGYCMPAEVFGPNYPFLPQTSLLSFDEILRVARITTKLGVRKIRLTGGEPLLRKGIDDLVAMLSALDGLQDLAMTTNGILLGHYAQRLAMAGLSRVTVSLDALDPAVFAKMNGVGAKVERVLAGIQSARDHGLPVKINAVIQKGINEQEIVPMVKWARQTGVTLRFIEFMDVGQSNGWDRSSVCTAEDILTTIQSEYPLRPLKREGGAVAERYHFQDGPGEIGIISSISKPFCHDCGRLRLSAKGELFGCLFAEKGLPLRELLRQKGEDLHLVSEIAKMWSQREDRYSELRGHVLQKKVEMSYIGG